MWLFQELLLKGLMIWSFWWSRSPFSSSLVLFMNNSCTSKISTLRLVFFLILIAMSCGINLPHTLTLLCFSSIKCVSNSILIYKYTCITKVIRKLKRYIVQTTKLYILIVRFGFKFVRIYFWTLSKKPHTQISITLHVKKCFPYFSAATIAVYVDPQDHTAELQ